jgi:hypothetical protein
MKREMAVTVRGKQHEWSFHFDGDPKYLQEWRDDGIEVYEIYNSIPMWVADAELTRIWCFVQDCFNFRNPFKT